MCWHQSEQQHFPIDADGSCARERVGRARLSSALHTRGLPPTLAWIHDDTFACKGCHHRMHMCVQTSCTHIHTGGHSCCKCQRQLGEKAGRQTWRRIHHWIRKQANITNNKQMISALRSGGLPSPLNPPLSVQEEGKKPANNTFFFTLPVTLFIVVLIL